MHLKNKAQNTPKSAYELCVCDETGFYGARCEFKIEKEVPQEISRTSRQTNGSKTPQKKNTGNNSVRYTHFAVINVGCLLLFLMLTCCIMNSHLPRPIPLRWRRPRRDTYDYSDGMNFEALVAAR